MKLTSYIMGALIALSKNSGTALQPGSNNPTGANFPKKIAFLKSDAESRFNFEEMANPLQYDLSYLSKEAKEITELLPATLEYAISETLKNLLANETISQEEESFAGFESLDPEYIEFFTNIFVDLIKNNAPDLIVEFLREYTQEQRKFFLNLTYDGKTALDVAIKMKNYEAIMALENMGAASIHNAFDSEDFICDKADVSGLYNSTIKNKLNDEWPGDLSMFG
ncbi:MAG: hypothetical protein SFT93_03145 [Rickettsiaceae bacterium]|nr:hypothetical protein [Rickettsiaceae bacterium]